LDERGDRVTDQETLARIEALAIPPAWEQVWICPWPNGHVQALGTDAKGRRQYRYHDAWRSARDRQKFEHVLDVARALPRIRARSRRDLARRGLPKERVLACAVRLLDVGFFRVGGEEYAEENGSFGLATMRREHAKVVGDEVIFDYPAKSGRQRVQAVVDPDVRDVIAALRRRRSGGPELLAFRRGKRWVDVRSGDINEYLSVISGLDVTAKDFRTWHATVAAAEALARLAPPPAARHGRRRAVRQAMCEVADCLGNTPAVCRSSYVDPRVVDRYLSNETIRPAIESTSPGAEQDCVGGRGARRRIEAAVVALLEDVERSAAA
jgi:DNA topoisomerase IB